jgi:murein L,D-transpeptidase YafK
MPYCLALLLSLLLWSDDFKATQLTYARVRKAYAESEEVMKRRYEAQNLTLGKQAVFFRVFKAEKQLELWAKRTDGTYCLIKSYPICSASGDLVPKRKMGDYQVPEGFYHIDRFNPTSSFYLSMGINYPNASDKIVSTASNLGGDIFIHGSCVSIGCMAMTDPVIYELYIAAVEAKNSGQQKTPVHIFPFRMTNVNVTRYYESYKDDVVLVQFWKNIKVGYDYFESNKKLPSVSVANSGKYIIGQ